MKLDQSLDFCFTIYNIEKVYTVQICVFNINSFNEVAWFIYMTKPGIEAKWTPN